MKRYILFAATCHNGSAIWTGQGAWLDTQYVLYSNGVCWAQSRFDRDCRDGKDLPEERKNWTYRLEEQAFSELQQLLQTQFDSAQAQFVADWIYWDMHLYGPSGAKLRTVSGSVDKDPVLKQITELLKKKKAK